MRPPDAVTVGGVEYLLPEPPPARPLPAYNYIPAGELIPVPIPRPGEPAALFRALPPIRNPIPKALRRRLARSFAADRLREVRRRGRTSPPASQI